MTYKHAAILLTCHSFDDFPVYYSGNEADSLLACWTALWHPCLLAETGEKPSWHRVDSLPDGDSPRLLVTPLPYVDQLDSDSVHKIEQQGSRIIRDPGEGRANLLQQMLVDLPVPECLDSEIMADFLALGFAYLQVELLTRQMRYATQVEETSFESTLVDAARAALAGDNDSARSGLQSCFDFLSQEREHYYAVDVYLLDLALTTDALMGAPLQAQLANEHTSNLLMEGVFLEQLRSQHAELYQQLHEAVEAKRIGLVGGEYREWPLSLLSSDTLDWQLKLGRKQFTKLLGRPATIFGRRAFGLCPALPQALLSMGFAGALHATFDGGSFPEAGQSKSRWEGTGQYSLDAILRAPMDATLSANYLKLATSLSESMDMDHIATRCFVHWVGQSNPWFEELQRVTKFTKALGRFVTFEEYFDETYDPGMHETFRADQYRSPQFVEQVAAGDQHPISRLTRYWRDYVRLLSWLNASTLRVVIGNDEASRTSYRAAESAWNGFHTNPFETQTVTTDFEQLTTEVAEVLTNQANDQQEGYLLFNPLSFPRRVFVSTDDFQATADQPTYAVKSPHESDSRRFVADVSGMGVATVRPASRTTRRTRKIPPPMAENHVLRNEFLEAEIDPTTGGLRGLRSYGSRTNQLTQQLAFRQQDPDDANVALYSTMQADSTEVVEADTLYGQIESCGRLLGPDDQILARFKQSYELWRGSRIVRMKIQLDDVQPMGDNPWKNYLAIRCAWPNEASDLTRGMNEAALPTSAKRFEAPLYTQISDGQESISLLTGGLPYHVRSGRRMLDTLMIVRNETARRFCVGLGVNIKQPLRAAIDFLAPHVALRMPHGLPPNPSAWLFHLDARNVVATAWQPIWSEDSIVGIRARICETNGRGSRVNLRSLRGIREAKKIDGLGQTVNVCEVEDDVVTFDLSPFEQTHLEANFVEPIAATQ